MLVGENNFKYEWIEDWVKIPDSESSRRSGKTHGVVVSKDHGIIIFNQADPAVLIYSPGGELINFWGDRFLGAHGMTLVEEKGIEYLWLTDEFSGEVVKTNLDGKTVLNVKKPNLEIYDKTKYSPTWVAVNEERFGGNGDIWVTDGYGAGYIHRYNKKGNYISSINGEEGKVGKFNCPHSISIDIRKNTPEFYIADRGNKRFQVYDTEGNFKRSFGADFLGCPCGSITYKNYTVVPELCARLAILNANDELISFIGRNESTCDIEGWPNHPKEKIIPGKFNSPHAAAVDGEGNIFVVEWIIGGRVTKLKRIS